MPAVRRYVAFLRGVMPTNAKMSELRAAFEAAGFTDVRTLLGSGNVLFGAAATSEKSLERKAEAAMQAELGRTFFTIVRSVATLRELIEADPWARFRVAPGAKRTVTFLRDAPKARLRLPIELDGARLLAVRGREILGDHIPGGPKGPVFMKLIEQTFGKEQTTRTWETVTKAAK